MPDRFDRVRAALADCAARTEAELASLYPEDPDQDISRVYEIEKYSLMAGGKRIRPFLVTGFCAAFGKDRDAAALRLAAAVEMMHTFSLIHDDLPCMDDDDLRRGRPTSHRMFGEAPALLGGDSLSIRAFETVMSAPMSAEERCRAASALADASGSRGMIGGQMKDMRGETERLDFASLLKLHSLKTGRMIMLSAYLGCVAAGLADGDPRTVAAGEYASKLGLAFQVTDDILDAVGDEKTLGKSVGGDAGHGKTTFLTYMSPEEAGRYAAKLTEEAKEALAPYPECGLLCDLADLLAVRKK